MSISTMRTFGRGVQVFKFHIHADLGYTGAGFPRRLLHVVGEAYTVLHVGRLHLARLSLITGYTPICVPAIYIYIEVYIHIYICNIMYTSVCIYTCIYANLEPSMSAKVDGDSGAPVSMWE